MADSDAILSVFHRPDVAALTQGPQTVPGQAEQTARFYGGEPGRGYPKLVAEPQKIRCPLLCLNDPNDNEDLRRHAVAAVEAVCRSCKIRSPPDPPGQGVGEFAADPVQHRGALRQRPHRAARRLVRAVHVSPVVDAHDVDGASGLIDPVNDPIGAAPRRVISG